MSKITRPSGNNDELLHIKQIAYNNTHSFISLLDLDGTVLDSNQTSLDLIGAKLDDVVGKSFWNTPWWTQCSDSTIETLKAAIRDGGTGKLTRFDATHTRSEGSITTIGFTLSAIRDDDGKLVALLSEGHDISATLKAQEALVESEQRFRSLVELSTDWFWEQDEHFRFIRFSEDVKDFAETPAEFYHGKTRWELPMPEGETKDWSEHQAVLIRHEPFRNLEYQRLNHSGELIWVSTDGNPIFDADNRFKGYRGTSRNITEQKYAQIAQKEAEVRLRLAVDIAGIGIWEWDMISDQVTWDKRQFELFGLPQVNGPIPLSSVTDVIHPEDRERLNASAKNVLEDGAAAVEEFRIVRADGSLRWLLGCSSVVHLNESKTSARLIGMNMDITESKETEMALRESEHRLKKTNATKSQFLAAASHDLRQPLQSLGFYLATLAQQTDSRGSLDLVKNMNQSLENMGELLEALLDVANLENGAIAPQIQDFPIQTLLDKLSASEQPHADKKGLTLTIDNSCYTVRSDPALLQRIVENFVANALRYTNSGSISVRCQCQDALLQIDVTDTGIGIPANALESIFDEYHQLSNPARDKHKGLGLGLATVKHIARLLDHRLVVHSVLGEGSTFSVELPLGESIDLTPPETTIPPLGKTADIALLLIEDDPLILSATQGLLQSDSVTVYCAQDGNEALEHLKNGVRPDLVITDYRLPDQNGIELMRQIRATIDLNIPCILMTGDRFNKDLEQANLTRCTILYKPVTPEQLLSAIVFESK